MITYRIWLLYVNERLMISLQNYNENQEVRDCHWLGIIANIEFCNYRDNVKILLRIFSKNFTYQKFMQILRQEQGIYTYNVNALLKIFL